MTSTERTRLHHAMVRFADGDRAAFREIFDALWPLCLAIATRALGHPADAEDTAQRAILKVFARIVDLDRARDGVAWAMTLAAFEVLTTRKQRARRRDSASTADVDVIDDVPSSRDLLLERELRDSVRGIIGELSELDQEALTRMLSGASTRDETERKRRFRAIERLRAAWRKAHG